MEATPCSIDLPIKQTRPKFPPWWFFETKSLFSDTPLGDEQWQRHHSWLRHLPEPARFFLVLYAIWPVVAWVLLVTVVAGLYAQLLQPKPGWPIAVCMNYNWPFTLTSFAVSLLLVFRTNSSYDRWWEARKAFGRMYNCVRILARLTMVWVGSKDAARAVQITRWTSILCGVTCTYLTDDSSYVEDLADVLSANEIQWILRQPQPPVAIMHIISRLFYHAELSPYQLCELERQLADYDVSIGVCERIRRQSIPMAYTRHTSRFLVVFVSCLPFALWGSMEWLTIPVMAVLTFLLVGIENIGIQIEQPLTVLPLRALAMGCRAVVDAVTGMQVESLISDLELRPAKDGNKMQS